MSRYYRDQYGNYGETDAAELPESVQELTEQEYNEAIASIIAEDEARQAAEEAAREAERQAREEAARQAAEEAARRAEEEARRTAEEAARRAAEEAARQAAEAERQRLINIYTNKVQYGEMSLGDVPEELRGEVEYRLNPVPTLEERLDKLENPGKVVFTGIKTLPANTWVSIISEQVTAGNYQVVTDATAFNVYCKGVVISTENPVFVEEDSVVSVQVMSDTAGDYIVKLYKI